MLFATIARTLSQATEEGGGVQIDLGIITLAAVLVIAVLLWHRRRRR